MSRVQLETIASLKRNNDDISYRQRCKCKVLYAMLIQKTAEEQG